MPDRLGETEHHSLRGFMHWSRWVLHVGHQLFDGALAFRPDGSGVLTFLATHEVKWIKFEPAAEALTK